MTNCTAHYGMANLRSTLVLSNTRLFVTALALSIAPLWFGPYLPMVDLPQHAAQIAALHAVLQGDSRFTSVFELNWFTPYLFGYLLLYAISTIAPIVVATKIIVCFSMISIPMLTGALLREVRADVRWRWLAIPGTYSLAFYWGFFSFMVAVPIAILLLILTVRFDREPTKSGAAFLAVYTLFLFFCHVLALGFSALVASSYLAGKHYSNPRSLAVRCIPLAAPLPLILFWLANTFSGEASVQHSTVAFGEVAPRLYEFLMQPSGLEHISSFGIAVTVGIALSPRLLGSRPTSSPARWLPFVVGALAFFLVPSTALNTSFLYQRLGIFLVPLWLMIWDAPKKDSTRFELLVMAAVIAWILANTARFASFARETESFDAVMANMAPGETAAMMIVDKRSQFFTTPVYLHFPAWYQASKGGIVDFNFADFHPQIVRYKNSRGPRLGEALAWAPWQFEWDRDGGRSYRYFVVKAPSDYSATLFKEQIGSISLIAHSGWWWLYENRSRQ